MDIKKIFEFLEQYPTWFKVAVVISLALAAVGLLTLRQSRPASSTTATTPTPASVPSAPAAIQNSPQVLAPSVAQQSLSSFHRNIRVLDGRFLELQESLKQMQGATVTWEGYVASVSDQGTRSHPILLIVAEGEAPNIGGLAAVAFPENLRPKAYSLQKGDFVRFVGIIHSMPSTTPALDAEKFELLRPRSGGSQETPSK